MTTKGLDRQPTKLDYASPTQFKFNVIKLPKVEYFCTSVNIPAVTLPDVDQPTRFKSIPLPGNPLEYGDLSLSFMVDENLINYREIHGWMTGLGFPKSDTEFKNLQSSGTDRFPTTTTNTNNEIGKGAKYGAPSEGGIYSDAILTILTSKNNPVVEVRFRDIFPTSLSQLQYDQQVEDTQYLVANISFKYRLYEFAEVGSSAVSVTTS